MSPERTITPQEDAGTIPKMSVPASPVAGTPICEAQSPISLLLAVAQAQNSTKGPDDDLTSLSWLHEKDILKGMNINPSPMNSINSTPNRPISSLLSDQSPTSDYIDDSSISPAESSNSSIHSPVPPQNVPATQRNKHPHNVPYDPLVHTNNKPPFSFSCLIFMAIEQSKQKALPVKEIYAWILAHFPYFQNAPTGWKNSVRHNLSLNKCFQKVEKAPNLGKGSLWTVDPQYKPNLLQALTRSPFHPCSTLDASSYMNNGKPSTVDKNAAVTRLPNPELFPYLSRKLASAEFNGRIVKSELSDDSLDAVDAAAVMLSLKNGPSYRQKKNKNSSWQVITTSPSQDHTYSAADSLPTDETFESDDERVPKSSICRKIDFEDDEEERKIKGAETLLNLAGILTRSRSNSSSTETGYKRMKLYNYKMNKEEKPAPFKPRLLRTRKKDGKQKTYYNNNNNEWVKHRRELENVEQEHLER